MKRAMVLLLLAAVGACGACGRDDAPPPTTHVADPGDVIDQDLMIALAQAKNYHHKAKVFMSDGNPAAAIAAVRQILSLRFPPNAPEADDVRNDARALLAKLLIGTGQLDEAARTVDEGLASSSRDSFFVANLYTVSGEIHEARAAGLAGGGLPPAGSAAEWQRGGIDKTDPRVMDERRAAIAAYDKSIQIDEALQKRLMERR